MDFILNMRYLRKEVGHLRHKRSPLCAPRLLIIFFFEGKFLKYKNVFLFVPYNSNGGVCHTPRRQVQVILVQIYIYRNILGNFEKKSQYYNLKYLARHAWFSYSEWMQLVRAKLWLKHVCLLRHKLVFCSKPLQGSSGNPEIRLYWLGHLEIRDLMGNKPCSEVQWSKFFVISAVFVAYRVNA